MKNVNRNLLEKIMLAKESGISQLLPNGSKQNLAKGVLYYRNGKYIGKIEDGLPHGNGFFLKKEMENIVIQAGEWSKG